MRLSSCCRGWRGESWSCVGQERHHAIFLHLYTSFKWGSHLSYSILISYTNYGYNTQCKAIWGCWLSVPSMGSLLEMQPHHWNLVHLRIPSVGLQNSAYYSRVRNCCKNKQTKQQHIINASYTCCIAVPPHNKTTTERICQQCQHTHWLSFGDVPVFYSREGQWDLRFKS